MILVFEDDPDLGRLQRMLTGCGHRVSAVDGRRLGPSRGYAPDADHTGCNAATRERPSDLPALKMTPATTTIPILMPTIKQEPADEFWASQVGIDAFRTKPVESPALLATVARLTESA